MSVDVAAAVGARTRRACRGRRSTGARARRRSGEPRGRRMSAWAAHLLGRRRRLSARLYVSVARLPANGSELPVCLTDYESGPTDGLRPCDCGAQALARPTHATYLHFARNRAVRGSRSGPEILPFAQIRPDFVNYESRRGLRHPGRAVRRGVQPLARECMQIRRFVRERLCGIISPIPGSQSRSALETHDPLAR